MTPTFWSAFAGIANAGLAGSGRSVRADDCQGPMRFAEQGGRWRVDCCIGRQVERQRQATYRIPSQACDRPTPAESTQPFIKRVVGLPGDTIAIVNGAVIRNGKPEPRAYRVEPCHGEAACNGVADRDR